MCGSGGSQAHIKVFDSEKWTGLPSAGCWVTITSPLIDLLMPTESPHPVPTAPTLLSVPRLKWGGTVQKHRTEQGLCLPHGKPDLEVTLGIKYDYSSIKRKSTQKREIVVYFSFTWFLEIRQPIALLDSVSNLAKCVREHGPWLFFFRKIKFAILKNAVSSAHQFCH